MNFDDASLQVASTSGVVEPKRVVSLRVSEGAHGRSYLVDKSVGSIDFWEMVEVGWVKWGSRIVDRDSFALNSSNASFIMALQVRKPYAEDGANLNVSMDIDLQGLQVYWKSPERRLL